MLRLARKGVEVGMKLFASEGDARHERSVSDRESTSPAGSTEPQPQAPVGTVHRPEPRRRWTKLEAAAALRRVTRR